MTMIIVFLKPPWSFHLSQYLPDILINTWLSFHKIVVKYYVRTLTSDIFCPERDLNIE